MAAFSKRLLLLAMGTSTILVLVNYVVLGSIENFVIFILLYILE
jgi:hypothetical protein